MPAPFFPVARKEYLIRRHAAFGANMIRILSPQPEQPIQRPPCKASDPAIAPINPPPYYDAGIEIALRDGDGDGYQSSTLLNTTSSHSVQIRRRLAMSNSLATLAPDKMRSNAYTIKSLRHMQRHIHRSANTSVVCDTNSRSQLT